MTVNRPVYLNLFKIRLPTTGVVSFAHRVSGALLFLLIPFSIYLLDRSLSSQLGFAHVVELLRHPVAQMIQLLLVWALAHHLVAGVRFLLLDLDMGLEKTSSTASAWMVFIGEALILAVYIWSVWL